MIDAEMQANRLDRIREDNGPLTLSDKAILRETAELLRSLSAPITASALRVDADEFETVEQWEHDDQRELSLMYNHAAHDRPQFNRGQMRSAIRHGKSLATGDSIANKPARIASQIGEGAPVVDVPRE